MPVRRSNHRSHGCPDKITMFTSGKRGQSGKRSFERHTLENLDPQIDRIMLALDAKQNALERYLYLINLSDRNGALFFRALMSCPARTHTDTL